MAANPNSIVRQQVTENIPPRLMRTVDAAKYLGTSDKTIRALILAGDLPYVQLSESRAVTLHSCSIAKTWIASLRCTSRGSEKQARQK